MHFRRARPTFPFPSLTQDQFEYELKAKAAEGNIVTYAQIRSPRSCH